MQISLAFKVIFPFALHTPWQRRRWCMTTIHVICCVKSWFVYHFVWNVFAFIRRHSTTNSRSKHAKNVIYHRQCFMYVCVCVTITLVYNETDDRLNLQRTGHCANVVKKNKLRIKVCIADTVVCFKATIPSFGAHLRCEMVKKNRHKHSTICNHHLFPFVRILSTEFVYMRLTVDRCQLRFYGLVTVVVMITLPYHTNHTHIEYDGNGSSDEKKNCHVIL